jgi:hypothetical protein
VNTWPFVGLVIVAFGEVVAEAAAVEEDVEVAVVELHWSY